MKKKFFIVVLSILAIGFIISFIVHSFCPNNNENMVIGMGGILIKNDLYESPSY